MTFGPFQYHCLYRCLNRFVYVSVPDFGHDYVDVLFRYRNSTAVNLSARYVRLYDVPYNAVLAALTMTLWALWACFTEDRYMIVTIISWTLLSLILGAVLGSTTMLGIFVHRFYWTVAILTMVSIVALVICLYDNEMIATIIVCQSAMGTVAGMLVAADVIIKRVKL